MQLQGQPAIAYTQQPPHTGDFPTVVLHCMNGKSDLDCRALFRRQGLWVVWAAIILIQWPFVLLHPIPAVSLLRRMAFNTARPETRQQPIH